MTGPVPYLLFGGTARAALAFYAETFGGSVEPAPRKTFVARGVMLSLLGTADPLTLRRRFDGLAQEGSTVDPLQERPWGASDGQVIDRFGVHWLIGYQAQAPG